MAKHSPPRRLDDSAEWLGLEICNYNQLLLCNIDGLVPFCRLMDQSVDSALFFFPFYLVLNCMLNSLDFFVFCISLSLYFPLALSLRMSFLFCGSLSEGYIPALCRLMPTRTSKIIIIIKMFMLRRPVICLRCQTMHR